MQTDTLRFQGQHRRRCTSGFLWLFCLWFERYSFWLLFLLAFGPLPLLRCYELRVMACGAQGTHMECWGPNRAVCNTSALSAVPWLMPQDCAYWLDSKDAFLGCLPQSPALTLAPNTLHLCPSGIPVYLMALLKTYLKTWFTSREKL